MISLSKSQLRPGVALGFFTYRSHSHPALLDVFSPPHRALHRERFSSNALYLGVAKSPEVTCPAGKREK